MKRKQITALLLAATMVSGQVVPAYAEEAIVGVEAAAEEEGALVEEEPVDGFDDEVLGDDFVGEEADVADLGGDLIEDAENADDGFVADAFEEDGELAAAGEPARAQVEKGEVKHVSGQITDRVDEVQGNVTFVLDGDTSLIASFGCWQQQDGLTFDLNGHTLTIPSGLNIEARWGCNITIKDSAGGGKVVADADQIVKQDGGSISITGGTFSFDPSSLATDTVKKNADGTWTVGGGEIETEPETPAAEPVVKIGEKGYATLQEAFDAAKNGDVLKLVSTIKGENNLVFPSGVKATLDFAGNTVNVDSAAGGQVKIYGDLTVKDSSNSTGVFTNDAGMSTTDALVLVDKGGALTITGKTAGILCMDDTTFGGIALEVKDGTFTCNDEGVLSGGDTALVVDTAGKAVINSSQLMCMALFSGADCIIVNGGELDVTGGEITGPANAINVKSGKLVVSGGNILSSQGGESVVAAAGATVEISGGIFSQEVKQEWCAAGYAPAANEDEATKAQYPYTVAKAVGVATIGTTVYKTLQEAFTAAKDGDKITLVDDLTSEKIERALKVPTGKSVSLDLAGHTLGLGSDANDAGVLTVDGGLTLLDSVGRGGILSAYVKDAMIVVNGTLDVKDDVIVMAIDADTFGGTCIKANSGAVVTIENGDVSAGDAVVDVAEGATLNVKGGLLMNSSFTGAAVVKTSGTTNIEGGQVIGLGNGVEQNAGTLNISGGQIKSTGGLKTFVINGGETAITGGVFGDAVDEAWCPEGYAPAENTAEDTKEDYPYTVEGVEVVYEVAIGDKQFTTLQKAIDAAKNGDTLTILKPIELYAEGGAVVPEGLSISLDTAEVDVNYNGNKYTYAMMVMAVPGYGLDIYGHVTFTDCNIAQSNIYVYMKDTTDASWSGINVYGNGSATVEKASFIAAGGTGVGNVFGLHDNAELLVNAEEANNFGMIRSQNSAAVRADDDSKITLTQGTLWNILNGPAVILNDNASMLMNGVEDKGDGTLKDHGGFIRSGGVSGYPGGVPVELNGEATLTMQGGRIRTDATEGNNFKKTGNASVAVSGGFVKQELLQEDCAPGYEPTTDTVYETTTPDVEYWTVKEAEAISQVIARSLTLEGQIGVNLAVAVPEKLLNDDGAYFVMTLNGRETKSYLKDCSTATVKSKTCKVVTALAYAKEMHDTITLKVYDGKGNQQALLGTAEEKLEGNVFTHSIDAYLEDCIAGKIGGAKLQPLAKAMLNYGVYAQEALAYEVGEYAPVDTIDDVTNADLEKYAFTVEGTLPTGVSYSGAALNMLTDTNIMLRFKVPTGSNLTFTIDGKQVNPEVSGSYRIVSVTNIAAKDLDEVHAFSVSDGTKTYTVNYSALSWACTFGTNTEKPVAQQNVAKAIYKYCMAANAYFTK